MTDEEKDQAVECATQVAKYAFMLAFSMSFPKDHALIAHNKGNLKIATENLFELEGK